LLYYPAIGRKKITRSDEGKEINLRNKIMAKNPKIPSE